MLAKNLKNEIDYHSNLGDSLGTVGYPEVPSHISDLDIEALELNASGVRKVLQSIFPLRRLVLSQFTLYNQLGITIPTGMTFSRGRRCYKLKDLLPVALILALKEQGIPNKNLENLPTLVQSELDNIFSLGKGCLVSGFNEVLNLSLLGVPSEDKALSEMLLFNNSNISANSYPIYWSYDVGYLSEDLRRVAKSIYPSLILDAKQSEKQETVVSNLVVLK